MDLHSFRVLRESYMKPKQSEKSSGKLIDRVCLNSANSQNETKESVDLRPFESRSATNRLTLYGNLLSAAR